MSSPTQVANDGLAGSIDLGKLSTTGTADATTYLRGDGAWSTVSSGGTNSPRFLAYKASGYQGYGTSTTAKVIFDTEEHDSDSAYDTSQSRFTVPTGEAGVYLFGFRLAIQDVGSNLAVQVDGYKNGTGGTLLANFTLANDRSTTANVRGQGTFVATLAEGDYVEMYVTTPATSGSGAAGLPYQFFFGFKLL